MANFRNLSEQKIVEIKYTTEFLDTSGKVIFKSNGSLIQDIKPGRSSRNKEFYSYPDNVFVSDDTYDILLLLIKAKHEEDQKISVRSIRFDGGDMLNFQN